MDSPFLLNWERYRIFVILGKVESIQFMKILLVGILAVAGVPNSVILFSEDVLIESKEAECVICLECMEAGETVARLPCLCLYHKSCIEKWFQVNRSCPEHPN